MYNMLKSFIYLVLANLIHGGEFVLKEVKPKEISVKEGDDVTFHCQVNKPYKLSLIHI